MVIRPLSLDAGLQNNLSDSYKDVTPASSVKCRSKQPTMGTIKARKNAPDRVDSTENIKPMTSKSTESMTVTNSQATKSQGAADDGEQSTTVNIDPRKAISSCSPRKNPRPTSSSNKEEDEVDDDSDDKNDEEDSEYQRASLTHDRTGSVLLTQREVPV